MAKNATGVVSLTPEQFARLEKPFEEARGLSPPFRKALIERVRQEEGAEMADYLEELLAAQTEETETAFEPFVRREELFRPLRCAFKEGDLILNRFRIIRLLGRGGMGEVYEAEDSDTGRVALKTIRQDLCGDRLLVRRFKWEVQLARMVTSPYVCRIHDVFTKEAEGNRPTIIFLTMEFLEGTTLADRIEARGSLPWREAEAIALQMCHGLEAVHRAGVIHRDFKSRNVMLTTRNGEPMAVVTDLGLAYCAEDTAPQNGNPLSRPGALMGTPDYMSPEQFEGAGVSTATDIYALGVVLYEMVTGKLPFEGPTPLAAAVRRAKTPPCASSIQPGLPSRWDRVIQKCLTYEPTERFQSAGEVGASLQRPSVATAAYRTMLLDDRRRRWFASAAASVALFAASFFGVRAYKQWTAHAVPAEAQVLYEKATESFRNGYYLTGTNQLQGALEEDHDFVLAHARLADAFTELDLTDDAEREVNKIKGELVAQLAVDDQLYIHAVQATVRHDARDALKDFETLVRNAKSSVDRASASVDLGRANERAGKGDAAARAYSKAVQLSKSSPAPFFRRGILEIRQGKQNEAAADFTAAEAIYRRNIDMEGIAELDYQRGYETSKLAGHAKEAQDFLKNSLDAAKKMPSLPLQIRTMTRLGAIEFGEGHDKEAADWYEKAVTLAEENGVSYWATDAKIRLGITWVNSGKSAEGEKKLRSGRREAERNQWPRLVALSQLNLAILAAGNHNWKGTIDLVSAALGYYEPLGFVQESTQCLLMLSRAKAAQGLLDESLRLAQKDLDLAKTFGNSTQILQAEEAIGGDLLFGEDYLGALPHLASAVHLSEGDPDSLPWETLLLAEDLSRLGRFDEAYRTLAIVPVSGWEANKSLKFPFARLQAAILASQGRFKEALRTAQDALRKGGDAGEEKWDLELILASALTRTGQATAALVLCDDLLGSAGGQSSTDIAAARLEKARALVELRRWQEARTLSEDAGQIFRTTGQKESELRSYWIAARCYRGTDSAAQEEAAARKALDILTGFKHNYGSNYQQYLKRSEIAEVVIDLARHKAV